MITRELGKIDESDLRRLVAQREPESQTLEYKQDLPGRDNSSRHEFLADICAFANSTGGDLLFGIVEDKEGCAHQLNALTSNMDEEQRRLADWILSGLEPRATGIEFRSVPVDGGAVFVVRVRASWNGPHRVSTNQHFFIREGVRKRQLDMSEVRSAFSRTDGQAARIRDFRADRVSKILAGETPAPLGEGVISVFHIVPIQPKGGSTPVDPTSYRLKRRLPVIPSRAGHYFRINLDGAVSLYEMVAGNITAYTIFFRDGTVEAVRMFTSKLDDGAVNIPSIAYERELIDFFSAMEAELHQLQLGPPYAVMYSLLRTRNAQLGVRHESSHKFDRDLLLYPEVVILERGNADALLKPVFDLVWQSADFSSSANFDEAGNWCNR
jgi:hypothetical protein